MWEPIESAPKDRVFIGGYFRQPWADSHKQGEIVKCWWQPEFDAFISSARVMSVVDGYTFDDGSTQRMHSPVIEKPSHWMEYAEPQD